MACQLIRSEPEKKEWANLAFETLCVPLSAQRLQHLTRNRFPAPLAFGSMQLDMAPVAVRVSFEEVDVCRHGLEVLLVLVRSRSTSVGELLGPGRGRPVRVEERVAAL